jgi:hypothetical protein
MARSRATSRANTRHAVCDVAGMRILLALFLLASAGCGSVDFTERRRLADPIMSLDEGPAETHLMQKTYYSREGSAGGIGSSAGGGCGCY